MDRAQTAINLVASMDGRTPQQSAAMACDLADAIANELDRRAFQANLDQLRASAQPKDRRPCS